MRSCLERLMPALALVYSLGLPAATWALPDDRDQPIRIEADEALRDEKQGFTRYQGNVRMDQGSLHIEADQLTVFHDDKEADRVMATGKPAKLQQQPEVDKPPIKASADTIEYFKREERVQLRENAYIEQDGSIVTGDSIDYLMNEQLVKAGSDKTSESSRVKVIIPAATLNQEEPDSGAPDSE
ncbi:lipopolysaccharide transport periplasmic protein LptA [Seongchinamella unica]|uniref:Lipopolysaccharide export system protein LptA n=1 Tax=Seongchinamella unica TaxID=2547392 RepID=A0A4R5LU99_9GAMM|nr:lipopolysaccharide transport periplasmic protein LptA [Seongchinamella unica]TDG14768.1 lipopolysaccharide transport periplasmic protein LptA [Seongchinamella unica]